MKVISLILLTIFLGKGCNDEKKQDMQTAAIEYTANTRGYFRKVVIQNQTATISKDRDGNEKPESIKINETDWKQLIASFQDIDLDEIPNLKAPSEKRFYDGAAIAGLKIIYKGKTYESVNFDHGNPPVEIEKLVSKITSFIKKNNDD